MPVTLKSRLPEIERELPTRVLDAVHTGARQIAQHASEGAPVLSGELRDSITAEPTEHGAEIKAAWYWYFVEFGTTYAPAHPFMIPAAERGRAELEKDVSGALRRL